MQLVTMTYDVTKTFPREEVYGLAQQRRRAAVSIPSNLAEGAARTSTREYANFISIARGSLAELDTQVQIAQRLGYITDSKELAATVDHVGRLLTGLHKKWKS